MRYVSYEFKILKQCSTTKFHAISTFRREYMVATHIRFVWKTRYGYYSDHILSFITKIVQAITSYAYMLTTGIQVVVNSLS